MKKQFCTPLSHFDFVKLCIHKSPPGFVPALSSEFRSFVKVLRVSCVLHDVELLFQAQGAVSHSFPVDGRFCDDFPLYLGVGVETLFPYVAREGCAVLEVFFFEALFVGVVPTFEVLRAAYVPHWCRFCGGGSIDDVVLKTVLLEGALVSL